MAITVGLDFGTHQTKICIENSDSPLHITYEFYEWDKGVYALPSVIQINKDRTLRYGSVDISSCLAARKKKHVEKPVDLVMPLKPEAPKLLPTDNAKLPPMPVHKFVTNSGFSMSIPYKDLYGIDSESNKLPKPSEPGLIATKAQKEQYQTWKNQCAKLQMSGQDKVKQNQLAQIRYLQELESWEKRCASLKAQYKAHQKRYEDSLTELPMVYRYFKQATFASYAWDWELKSCDLTVLYLAYIIFRLEERFGTDFSIQMGIPASEKTFSRLKEFAAGYLIQAYRLVEEVFNNDFERFLRTPYEELIALIPKYEYSEELKEMYGLIILPEAYAALRSVTVNSRIPRGMSLMLDIGGGTTDISFFLIEENGDPHIYHFDSISKGLNFFLEYEERQSFRPIEITHKKELKDISKSIFTKAQTEYNNQIDAIIAQLTVFLHQDTITRGFAKSAFRKAIQDRPVIYTGGGSTDARLRRAVREFTDVKLLDKRILNIPNVIRENSITIPYSLLATAFGLSIQRDDDNIKVSKKEDLFAKFSNINACNDHLRAHREHGMYED